MEAQRSQPDSIRLDKWLWAARFFKTRQLASEAIIGGKVHLNGRRTKPGKEVRIGSSLRIHKGSLEWNVVVNGLSRQRRPASEARTLFTETEESFVKRQQMTEEKRQLRTHGKSTPRARPSKRERRRIERFTRKLP